MDSHGNTLTENKLGSLEIYDELEQGSDKWVSARCGLITASQMNLILTPTLKLADNDKTKKHIYELAAQRLTSYIEPQYVGENHLRGHEDEIKAREAYADNYAPVREVGGMVRDFGGFKIWVSPDGLVGEAGGIECKSRLQRYQIQTFVDWEIPVEHRLQVQTALLVSGRNWWDYVSYSGGLPMAVIRAEPDETMQAAILNACEAFEEKVQRVMQSYKDRLDSLPFVVDTERSVDIMEVFDGRE